MNKVKKNLFTLNVILSIVLAVAGLTTIIFSSLAIANVKGFEDGATAPIRYLLGTSLCLSGLVSLLISYCKETFDNNFIEIGIGAILIGFGIFFFLDAADTMFRNVIGIILPLLVITFGSALLLKSFIALLKLDKANLPNKKQVKTQEILLFIVGIALAAIGILFLVFRDKLFDCILLIVGVILTLSGTASLVVVIKEHKKENPNKDKKEEGKDSKDKIEADVKEQKEDKDEKKTEDNKKEEQKDTKEEKKTVDVDTSK